MKFLFMNKTISLNFRFDIHFATRRVMERELTNLDIKYRFLGAGDLEIISTINELTLLQLKTNLHHYGIEVSDHPKESLIVRIKELIKEMIEEENPSPFTKTSQYLSEKLNMNYNHISNIFSEMTLSTIENYIILQKIEKAKSLLIQKELTLTEIAHQLNYSSVAHLSNQFKKTTGLTPSAFQRIVFKKKSLPNN
jgi:AraC-like DNA-binding protein